ncbi:DUF418 domain-containing protein [Arenimonas sp. GDDSR-1]|uniref:DUF418 domain-containing protein n=1 Tax=Arenimonas sp. GDDSR-1 TaxID=2950125 RepID=UPI00261FBD5F|nr:DUF418 domain-containing protein [Arenimonas sp. GDDSR-1]
MTSTDHEFRPTGAPERIDMLDAIRGFALFGILLMNLEAFNGPIMQAMSGIDPTLRGADRLADAFIYVFVQGKFWTLFSLLFGIGFAMMHDSAARSGGDFRRIYKRRLWALLAIGAAHAVLVWEGDILFTYALAGFILLWRMKSDAPPRLYRILLVYCAPLALLAFAGVMAGNHDDGGDITKMMADEIRHQGHSTYLATLQWRAGYFLQGLGNLIILLPMATAMFALGVRLHRLGWSRPATSAQDSGGRAALYCYIAGLALMAASIAVAPQVSMVRIDAVFAAVNVLNMLAGLLMCLGMFFGLRWLWTRPVFRKRLAVLAPLGRMALSNYLGQSLVCTLIFCGYGLGYFQQLPRAWHIPFAIGLITLQTLFSTWWLGRFSMGPAEYLWRWLTYGKRPKFVS